MRWNNWLKTFKRPLANHRRNRRQSTRWEGWVARDVRPLMEQLEDRVLLSVQTYHFDATVTSTGGFFFGDSVADIAVGDVFHVEYSFDDAQTDEQAITSFGDFPNAAQSLKIGPDDVNAGSWAGAPTGVTIGGQSVYTSNPGTFTFAPQSLSGTPTVNVTGGISPGPASLSQVHFETQVPVHDTGAGQTLLEQIGNPIAPTGFGSSSFTFGFTDVGFTFSDFAAGPHPRLPSDSTGPTMDFGDAPFTVLSEGIGGPSIRFQDENVDSGEVAANLFDDNPNTKWLDFALDEGTRASFVEFETAGDARYVLSSYTLTSANDEPARDPLNFRLLATNVTNPSFPGDYVELDSQTGVTFGDRFEKQIFNISNSIAYHTYRLVIDRVADPENANSVQLSGWELIGLPEGETGTPANFATISTATAMPARGMGYATLAAQDGARHVALGPMLGAVRDAEFDGQPDELALGDDLNGEDDEDGVMFASNPRVGQLNATVTVNVQGADTLDGAKLDAWIDFNGDGNWGGPGEQIFDSVAVTNGDNALTFDVPSWAPAGSTFARFRLSTVGGLGIGGLAADGEVEDIAVIISGPIAGGEFLPAVDVGTIGGRASSVFAADLDNDGDNDIVKALSDQGQIVWYETHVVDGVAEFEPYDVTLPYAIPGASSVFVADMDGDGDLDIVAADLGNHTTAAATIYLIRNLGEAGDAALGELSFDEPEVITFNTASSVFIADMDADGDPDVVAALSNGFNTGSLVWYANDGTGDFSAPSSEHAISAPSDNLQNPTSVYAADLDRDGDLDIVAADSPQTFVNDYDTVNTVLWYENTGSDSFTQRLLTTSTGSSVFVADIDSDGDQDIVAALDVENQIVWFENQGNSAGGADLFLTDPHVAMSDIPHPTSVFATDLDGDGDTDIVASDNPTYEISTPALTVYWLKNDGNESFSSTILTESTANSVFVADLNNDGRLDVIAGTDASVLWIEQIVPPPPPANNAPTVANAIPNQNAGKNVSFSFTFNANTFNDADGDTLTYTATKSDGDMLPSWLNFDAGTRTFSGTPANGDVGTLSIKVTATDTSSASVSDEFDIVVANAAQIPAVMISALDHQNMPAFWDFFPASISDAVTFPSGPGTFSGPGFSATIGSGDTVVLRFEAPANNKFVVHQPAGASAVTFFVNAFWRTGSGDITSPPNPTPTVTFENLTGIEPTNTYNNCDISDHGNAIIFERYYDSTGEFSFTALRVEFVVPPGLTSAMRTYGAVESFSSPSFGARATFADSPVDQPVMSIVSANSPPTASLSVTTHGDETGPVNIVYTVTLSKTNDTGSAITFDLDDLGTGTATSGSDYTAIAANAQISVAAGASTGTLTVLVTDDALLEATETVIAQISNPSNGAVSIGTAVATANITDNDTATADLSVTTHGDEAGPANIVYTVTLSKTNDTGSEITFDLDDLATGTATSGSDYTAIAANAQISVADGASTGTLTVLVSDDTLLEAMETLIAQISNSSNSGVTIGTASATANITDNDTATASLSTTTHGNEAGPANIVYTVTLTKTNNTGSAITFDLDDLGTGTATAGSDYTSIAANAQISVAAGASTGTLTVLVTDDTLPETTETVIAQISNSSNAAVTVGTASATANITDNDITYSISTGTVTVTETAQTVTFTVTRSGATTSASTVDFAIAGMAANGSDYNSIGGTGGATTTTGTISFVIGQTSKTITLNILTDTLAEGDETIVTTLSHATAPGTATISTSSATTTINDDDLAYSISTSAATVTETAQTVTFTVSRSGSTNDAASTVNFAIAGTASNGTDYNSIGGTSGTTTTTGTISFAVGQISKTITLNILTDTLVEGDETILTTLSNGTAPGSATMSTSTAKTTITDSVPPTITPNVGGGLIIQDSSGIRTDRLTVTYDAGTNSLIFVDTNNPLPTGVGTAINANTVRVPLSALTTQKLTFNLGGGNDKLDISTVPSTLAIVVNGGDGDDTIYANNSGDTINTGTGNDVIDGGIGNDTVFGGSGADTITGGDGVDSLSGDGGNDTLIGGNDNDALLGGDGDDSVTGDAGADNINGGNGNDTLDGGSENDIIKGSSGDDAILGGTGDDQLYGENDKDTIAGGTGNDLISGGNGDDYCAGQAGIDTVSGDSGSDKIAGGSGTGKDTLPGNISDMVTDVSTDIRESLVLVFNNTKKLFDIMGV